MLQMGPSGPAECGAKRRVLLDVFIYERRDILHLGPWDVIPLGRVGRTLVVVEAGLGFAFLGGVISVLAYRSTRRSRRESEYFTSGRTRWFTPDRRRIS